MKEIKPLRVAPSFTAAGRAVAFSSDGRFLAADGTVWNVSDWSRAGGFDAGNATIEQVTFSSDGNSLYVFGGGTGRQVHVRYDWRTEKAAQEFKGHKSGVFWGWLSADGRTMASASYYDQTIRIWDAASGKVVRTFELPENCFHVAISPDGSTIVRQTAEHLLKIERLAANSNSGPATEIQLPGFETNEIAFSPDGKSLICTAFSSWEPTHGRNVVELRLYDATNGFQLKTNVFMSTRRCTGLAVAPNNKFMVIGDQEGRAWALSLPDLKIVRELLAQKSNFNISSGSIAFSPDGQMLVIGSNDEPVHLFNAVTWEPITPGAGHKGEVSDICFTNDGRSIRTIGKDNTICLWDAATMKLLKQTPIPDGYCVGAVRPPDGQIILCPTFNGYEQSVRDPMLVSSPVKVFDADAGKVVGELNLPVHWTYRSSKVLWLNDSEALSLDERHWRRFDYRSGKILDTRSIDISAQNELFNGLAEVTEGGKTLLSISGGGKISRLDVIATDVATGKSTPVGQTTLPSLTGNCSGLVPGGKYLYVGDPGLYLFDRKTLKPALAKQFTNLDLLALAFNRDGSRFAVVTGARIIINGDLQQRDPGTQSMVRVHETATGKTLVAFPSSARWVRGITFDPDGRRLALALEGGTIEVWNLPDGPTDK